MAGILSKEFWVGSDPYRPKQFEFGATGAAQSALTQQLQARAAGQGPSAAELSMQRGMGMARQSAGSMAAGMRGAHPGLAARMAMSTQAGLQGQTAQQGAVLRAQEQATAEQRLSQHLYGMQGQRLGAWGQYQQMRMGAQPGSAGFFGEALGTGMQAAGAYFGAKSGA